MRSWGCMINCHKRKRYPICSLFLAAYLSQTWIAGFTSGHSTDWARPNIGLLRLEFLATVNLTNVCHLFIICVQIWFSIFLFYSLWYWMFNLWDIVVNWTLLWWSLEWRWASLHFYLRLLLCWESLLIFLCISR